LSTVEPSVAGPKRPQDRVALSEAKASFEAAMPSLAKGGQGVRGRSELELASSPAMTSLPNPVPPLKRALEGEADVKRTADVPAAGGMKLRDGSIVIAAITSCTNTSNPSVLIEAGLLAKKAVEAGLTRRPWVKTSLAPGSKVFMDYLKASGLIGP